MSKSYASLPLSVRALIKDFPAPALVCRCNDDFEIIASNEQLWCLLECESEEDFMQFCQGSYFGLVAFEGNNLSREAIREARINNISGLHHNYFRVQTRLGNVLDVQDKGYAIELPGGEEVIMCMFELNEKEGVMAPEAHDSLTGFYTQRQFLKYADEVLEEAYQNDTYDKYYIIYGNIRNFKMFNIKYGTEAGDRVLKDWRDSLTRYYRGNIHARFLGDHFVTLSSRKNLLQEAAQIGRDFDKKYSRYGIRLKAGICHLRKDMKAAVACDLAKIASDAIRNEGDLVRLCDTDIEKKMDIESYILANLDKAIINGYIKVFFQPVMRTINGNMCGMEALARWIDPERGFLSPGDFIPVLEEHHLITKLDLQILRLVCAGMRDSQDKGLTIIPVSFNLSRLDFTSCDIFQEVDNIVLSYGVARDMINIEITESTIMKDPKFMREQIARFRNGGYQVWMDDFGSGYSSLNVLKEFDFDEIKLDMAFLSTFDKKSQSIIKSIIKMAKSLGIQTLAEGVETKEQYEFLREIGCEKAQGYYFSKPMPAEELFPALKSRNTVFERRKWRNYYDTTGAVDFLTDKSKSLLEYDGENFNYVYVNKICWQVWRSLGAYNLDTVLESMNSPSSPLSRQFREIEMALGVEDGVYETFYSVRGYDVRLMVRCLAKQSNKSMYEVEIINLSNNTERQKREDLESAYHLMYSLYDSIYLLNLKNYSLHPLKQLLLKNDRLSEELKKNQRQSVDLIKKYFINPADMLAYEEFTDTRTLGQRLAESENGYISKLFRTRKSNGVYAWKAHTILAIPNTDKAIYSTRVSPLAQNDLLETIKQQFLLSDDEENETVAQHGILHRALMESDTINLFWKDRERRFLGANQKFMQTFGFKSQEDFIGKTDEEMGWHLDDAAFRNDELDVIRNGAVLSHRIGTCIVQGVAQKLLSSKEPLYDNGEIVGLVGSFVKVNELEKSFGNAGNINLVDTITGVKSMQGMISALTDYLDGFNVRGERFAVIKVYFDEYDRAVKTYGLFTARKMLKDFAGILTSEVGYRGTCARVYGGEFAIAIRYANREIVDGLMERLKMRLNATRELAGYKATLKPAVKAFHVDELQDPRDMFACVLSDHVGTLIKESQDDMASAPEEN